MPPQFGWYTKWGSGSFGTLFFHLLPFIEQQNLYNQSLITSGTTIYDPNGYTQIAGTQGTYDSRIYPNIIGGATVKTYACPADPSLEWGQTNSGWGTGSYAGNFQVFGLNSPAPGPSVNSDDTTAVKS